MAEKLTIKGTWMKEVIHIEVGKEVNLSIDKTFDHDITISKKDAIKLAMFILNSVL